MTQDDLEDRLKSVFADRFGEHLRAQLGPTTEMKDIPKWNSLTFVELVGDLEDAFGVVFAPHELADMLSYTGILALVRKKVAAKEQRP